MNISVKGEYALYAMLDLATQHRIRPVKIADIAKRQNIPRTFLELILSGLKQGGFVESRRGAEGGYLLARPPDAITVGEILRFMERRKASSEQRQKADTPFTDIWAGVEQAVSQVLDRTTFADIARRWREKQSRYVPDWNI